VSLRAIAGSGASRALVTLDGAPQNDPFGGWVIWSALPSEAIASAELVRGAGSGPYGAGALTGVVRLQGVDSAPGGYAANVSGGTLDDWRGAAVASTRIGATQITGMVGGESSAGWRAVRGPRAGAADVPLKLTSQTGSLSITSDLGEVSANVRVAGYSERRSAGLVGADSRVKGGQASATLAAQPTADHLGWRVQAWVSQSDLYNSSVSTAPDRSFTTPANVQYATPATGFGVNAAVRAGTGDRTLEVGADLRRFDGESRERFRYMNGAFTRTRASGGAEMIGGLYAEAQQRQGPWLFAEGLRADGWSTTRAHRTERDIANGATTLDIRPEDRSGVVPTGRLGVRRELDTALGAYVRAAAYAGFRPPTLNELHRPFRVGNDLTEANAALKPERLYGAEFGGGLGDKHASLSAALFYNRLEDAIANVTQRAGPFTDPVAGVIPAGGVLRQRMNAGAVDAYGLEAEARWAPLHTVVLTAAAAYTHAEVDGGDMAPQLTGLRPAQTPRLTMTAGARWQVMQPLTLSAAVRYESARFDDDQNIRRLAPATTLDARAEWRLSQRVALAVAVDNLTDTNVQTGRTADGVIALAPPRTARLELRIVGG
jgi:outer membrane receptor protein involved in Fe transport